MKKIRLISDPVTLTMNVVLVAVTIPLYFFMVLCLHEGNVNPPTAVVPFRIVWSIMHIILYIAIISASPRYLCVITLSETAITIWVPFRKKKSFTYKQFRNIYCGGYFHGNIAGIGKIVWYIVLAQRHLSSNELNQINLVSNSEEVVKIRYSRKNYEKLCTILPSDRIRQLECAVSKIQSK